MARNMLGLFTVLMAFCLTAPRQTIAHPPEEPCLLATVSVAYADTVHRPFFTPTPWRQTPGIFALGTGDPVDTGAILIQNRCATKHMIIDGLTVVIGTRTFRPWNVRDGLPVGVEPKAAVLFSQTLFFNFNTSETCTLANVGAIPVISLELRGSGGRVQRFVDHTRVLNGTACLPIGNEGRPWVQIYQLK